MAQQHVLLIAEKPESEALFLHMHLQEVYYIVVLPVELDLFKRSFFEDIQVSWQKLKILHVHQDIMIILFAPCKDYRQIRRCH